jgi:hypothetical protein
MDMLPLSPTRRWSSRCLEGADTAMRMARLALALALALVLPGVQCMFEEEAGLYDWYAVAPLQKHPPSRSAPLPRVLCVFFLARARGG